MTIFQDFFKRTPENHPDHSNLSKALTKMVTTECIFTSATYIQCSWIQRKLSTFVKPVPSCFVMFTKSNLAVYINNQLQTTVGQKAMVDLRSRVEGLKVRNTVIKSSGFQLQQSSQTGLYVVFSNALLYICHWFLNL